MLVPDPRQIKLVIWDLDDTLWLGTLAEGTIEYVPRNHELVVALAERGIVSSLCSNNDLAPTRALLERHGLWSYFVFPYVGPDRKGPAIRNIVDDAQLRSQNVLFIDDRPANLQEARYFVPGILTMSADRLPAFRAAILRQPASDARLERLSRYRVLEDKKRDQRTIGNGCASEEEFLRQSRIRVQLVPFSTEHVDRVFDLITRTNQLNFTQKRISRQEVDALCRSRDVVARAVNVVDRYGDYGLVGFYALRTGRLEHFLFSCRILNMGIENWVYGLLGRPPIDTERDTSTLANSATPTWIEVVGGDARTSHARSPLDPLLLAIFWLTGCVPRLRPAVVRLGHRLQVRLRRRQVTAAETESAATGSRAVLLKGGCIVQPLEYYLGTMGGMRVRVEDGEWSATLVLLRAFVEGRIDEKVVAMLSQWCVDPTFATAVADPGYDVFFFSFDKDYRSSYYEHVETGLLLPIAPFDVDLTDERNWSKVDGWRQDLASGPWHNPIYSRSGLRWLRETCRWLDQGEKRRRMLEDVEWLCRIVGQRKGLLLLLDHSTLTPERCSVMWHALPDDIGRLKPAIRELEKRFAHTVVIDAQDHVRQPTDFRDGNPFHYRRHVTYAIVRDCAEAIRRHFDNERTGAT